MKTRWKKVVYKNRARLKKQTKLMLALLKKTPTDNICNQASKPAIKQVVAKKVATKPHRKKNSNVQKKKSAANFKEASEKSWDRNSKANTAATKAVAKNTIIIKTRAETTET